MLQSVRIVEIEGIGPGPFAAMTLADLGAEVITIHRADPPEARAAAFYRAWTRKEAYLKAWGTGLSFGSDRFTLDYVSEGGGGLLATEMPGDDPSRWHFKDVELGPDYLGAICFEGPDRPIRWWAI